MEASHDQIFCDLQTIFGKEQARKVCGGSRGCEGLEKERNDEANLVVPENVEFVGG